MKNLIMLVFLITNIALGNYNKETDPHSTIQYPQVAAHPNTSDTNGNDPNKLDHFFEKCTNEKIGITLKTQRTVIVPLTTCAFVVFVEMSRKPESDFIEPKYAEKFDIEDSYCYLKAFEKMRLEEKMGAVLNDYAIFVLDGEGNLDLAGSYSIANPDNEGWAEVRFLLRGKYRNKKLGHEVVTEIDKKVGSLIGQPAKIIKYRESENHIIIDLPQYDIKVKMEGTAEAYTADSSVPFCGLQGWIHEDNTASIKLYKKCGWLKVEDEKGKKKEMDLSGDYKTFYLYRRGN